MRRHSLAHFSVAILLLLSFTSQVKAQLPKTLNAPLPNTSSFFIPDFNDGFTTRGDAYSLSQRCYLITEDANNRFGRLWWNTKLDLTKPFRLDFIIFAGDKDGSGADGFGFVLQTDPRGFEATGRAGGGLGFGDYQFANKILPSVAVEFDTWRNTECPGDAGDDPSYDHTAISYNGNICDPRTNELESTKTPQIHPDFANIEDNSCYDYVILWQPNADGTQTIQMYVEEQLRISHTADMITTVFGGVTNVNYGFTGSTGGARNEQTVCLSGGQQPPLTAEDFYTTPQNTSKLLTVRDNDIVLNPDLDSLWTFTIVTSAANGSSYIDGTTLDIMYTPNVGFAGRDSVQYQICDVPVGRCYSLCSQEWAYIDVTCVDYNFNLDKLTDNELCNDALPDNGSAAAYVGSGVVANNGVSIWKETFNELATDATVDNGTTSWSKSATSADYAKVVNYSGNKKFEVNDSGGNVLTWTSGAITTTGYSNVTVQLSIQEIGQLESSDYIKAYYKIGSNAKVQFFSQNDDISGGSTSAAKLIPNGELGSTLQVIVEFKNDNNGEYYNIDDIHVTGDAPPSVSNITAGYTFRWYNGTPGNTNPADLVYTGATYNTMAEGTYTVQATSDYGCDALPLTVTIDRVTEAPVVVVNQLQPVTNCGSPNGSLEAYVDVNGVATTTGYTFLWYVGVDFTSSFATGPVATNLKAQNYSVRVINNTSGCQAVEEETVTSTLASPTVQAQVTSHVTSCANLFSGAVSASSGGATAGFTFKWYEGTSIKLVADYTGATVTGLTFGDYTVQAINSSGCVSEPVTITVLNNTSAPAITANSTSNKKCVVPYNGQLEVFGTSGATAGYTFTFYNGNSTSNANKITATTGTGSIVSGNKLLQLNSGQYTVKVTHTASGCSNTKLLTVASGTVNPAYNGNAFVTPRRACPNSGADPKNGAIDASGTVTTGGVASAGGYKFDLYTGNNATGQIQATNSTGNFPALEAGNYTIKATDLTTGCSVIFNGLQIQQTRDEPNLSGAVAVTGSNTGCTVGNGSVKFDVTTQTGITPENGYKIEIYKGSTVSGTPYITQTEVCKGLALGATCTANVNGLLGGTYTVVITNTTSMCVNTNNITFTVPNGTINYPEFLISNVVNEPNSGCTAADGRLRVVMDDGVSGTTTGYTFKWYYGATTATALTNSDPGNGSNPGINNNEVTGLAGGQYTVVATSDPAQGGNGCTSQLTMTVANQTTLPDIAISEDSPAISCNGSGTADLSASVTENGTAGITVGYDFAWYAGSTATGTILSSTPTLIDKVAGSYTVKVTNQSTGCINTLTYVVNSTPVKPIATLNTKNPNTFCNTNQFNGGATVDLSFNGSAVADYSGYTFVWYIGTGTGGTQLNNGDNSGAVSGAASRTITGLNGGLSYTVVATNTATGCVSDPLVISIVNNQVPPNIVVTKLSDQTNCDVPNNGSLSADVTVSGTPQLGVGYTFQWYAGGTVSGAVITTNRQVDNLAAGTYTVRVTNQSTGCVQVLTSSVSQVLADIDGAGTKADSEDCSGNGSITITSASITTSGAPVVANSEATILASYNLTLQDASNADITDSDTDGSTTFGGLMPGTYYVVITHKSSSCDSEALQFDIADNAVSPTLSITEDQPSSVCPGGTGGDGAATVTVTNAGGSTAYTYKWHTGTDTSTPIDPVLNTSAATATLTGVAAGFYTVLVTDNASLGDGCFDTETIEITLNQPTISISTFVNTGASNCVGLDNGSYQV
ncbi:hypothetical protein, partial [uncultured Imperialibacter sp.]|uniref:lectin-like domain-containing protein n=1 Tax=uncultured Imperialibacter sp. TaxID=1672639 RepID=UPI0030D73395